MTIPDYETLMLPLLKVISDKREWKIRDTFHLLSEEFGLSDDQEKQLLPSGNEPVIHNRIRWANFYLQKAGLINRVKRGIITISEEGSKILESNPINIDGKFLSKYESFREFKNKSTISKNKITSVITETPDEILEKTSEELNETLVIDILNNLIEGSPSFFEKVVLDLLLAMGYGGSRREAAEHIGRPGDEGIDGLIKQDRLGLEKIYVQAKRWSGSVGRPQVQAFAGSLEGFRAQKGIILTTSDFSRSAKEYVSKIGKTIVLIDGKKLASLMIENEIGVYTSASYKIRKIDSDYFEE